MKKLVGSREAWVVGAIAVALTVGCGGPESADPRFFVHDGDTTVTRTLDPIDPPSEAADDESANAGDGSPTDGAEEAPAEPGDGTSTDEPATEEAGEEPVGENTEPALVPTLLWIDSDSFPLEAGASAKLQAFARFDDGSYAEVTDSATWTSTAPSVAAVVRGEVHGMVEGTATVLVALGGLEDFVEVVVGGQPAEEITLVSVHVDLPDSLVTLDAGELLAVTLHGVFSDGSEFDLTEHASWNTSEPTICGVEAGTLSANAPGYAAVTVTFQGHTVQLEVDVHAAE